MRPPGVAGLTIVGNGCGERQCVEKEDFFLEVSGPKLGSELSPLLIKYVVNFKYYNKK